MKTNWSPGLEDLFYDVERPEKESGYGVGYSHGSALGRGGENINYGNYMGYAFYDGGGDGRLDTRGGWADGSGSWELWSRYKK